MDCIDAIRNRKSIRRYIEKPVEYEKVMALIEAATHAPCAGNLQEWKFIVITKKPLIRDIAGQCGGQHWVATAPAIIVVCSDIEKQSQYYGLRGERLYCVQNAAAAIQNMLLTATSLGLGACWIGAFDEARLQDMLGIPPHVRPQALLTVGYAAEEPRPRELHPIENCVFFNKYGLKIEKVHRVLKDFSEEWQDQYEKVKPKVDQAAEKLKNIRKKILKR